MLVTGITLVRGDFLRENQAPVVEFLEEHAQSALFTTEHVERAAGLIAAQSIVEGAPITQKAFPYYNIVCLTGQEMKGVLSGYLSTLMEQGPKSIDRQLPEDGFCYMP